MKKQTDNTDEWILKREGLTRRQWKQRKRREIKMAIRAFQSFQMGCAYTPLKASETGQVLQLLGSIERQLSVEEWGR